MEALQIIVIGSIVFLGCIVFSFMMRFINVCSRIRIRVELEEQFM